MDTDQNRNSPAKIGSSESEFLEQQENSSFVPPIRVNPCPSVVPTALFRLRLIDGIPLLGFWRAWFHNSPLTVRSRILRSVASRRWVALVWAAVSRASSASHQRINSSTFTTIRCCSASGGGREFGSILLG